MTSAMVKVDSAAVTNIELENLADNFFKFRRFKSEKTRQSYCVAIRQMFKWLAVNGITQPSRADLEKWLDRLSYGVKEKDSAGKEIWIEKPRSASTVNLYATASRIFFAWLADEKLYSNIADKLKTNVTVDNTVHKKGALTATEGAKLIQTVQSNKNKKFRKSDAEKNMRDVAMIMMMMFSGCRTVELMRANVADFISAKRNGGTMPIQRKGHTEKDGFTRLATQTITAIEKYLELRGIDTTDTNDDTRNKTFDNAPLFATIRKTTIRNADKSVKSISERGDRLSTQSISKITKKYLRSINKGGSEYSAHALRHTCATLLFKAKKDGANIADADIQNLLGHKSLSTTMIYNNDVNIKYNMTAQFVTDTICAAMMI